MQRMIKHECQILKNSKWAIPNVSSLEKDFLVSYEFVRTQETLRRTEKVCKNKSSWC